MTVAAAAVPPSRSGAGFGARLRNLWLTLAVPLGSIVLALIVGAVIILASEFVIPGHTFDPWLPLKAYDALLLGAIGSWNAIVHSLVVTTPLVLGGLSVAFGFKAGLFNIGAQGQFLMGVLGSVMIGVTLRDQAVYIAVPAAVIGGALFGAAWGFIPGFLKAFSGAHEVVTTIMLNYIAAFVLAGMVNGPLRVPAAPSAVTQTVGNAALPILFGRDGHIGLLIALIAVGVVQWLLYRTTFGFEVRTTGANPEAARYAGMRPRYLVVVTMSICGLLAGLAGTCELLGITHKTTSSFATTVGFDAIAVALLARSNPIGVLFSAMLFGFMRAGAGSMQIQAGIPVELVDVLQATVLFFLVANVLVRRIFRLRNARTGIGAAQNFAANYGNESTV
jgi:general nucleoside transport system permease protein